MVYIDNIDLPFRNMIMCHMIADTRIELLEMCDKIGVQRKWIQKYDSHFEHFDISAGKKKQAIEFGAVEISARQLVEKCNRLKDETEMKIYKGEVDKWKVIIICNFGKDSVSDRLYQEGLTKKEAKDIAEERNSHCSEYGPDFYKAVPASYVLYDAYKDLP